MRAPPWSAVAALVLGLSFGASARALEKGPRGVRGPRPSVSQGLGSEVEPNGTAATATPIAGTSAVLVGSVFPNGDVDFYSFAAQAGDRVYVATMTSFSASGNNDSVIDVIGADGTTILETDDNDGSLGPGSSSIAGTVLPASGTYYVRVRSVSATTQLRPYHLHFQIRSGSPTAETEPNDATATANALPVSGWVSGVTSSAADVDFFSLDLNAGDTVFASLDLDPERDGVEWNGFLGFGLFNGTMIPVSDAGAAGPDSEALFMTVKNAGTYYVSVAASGTFGTYQLSVTVHPATPATANCTTYTSTDVPKTLPIGPGPFLVTSTLTIPGNPRIADLDVAIQLNHTFMADLDVHLVSPAGNDNGLFTDIGGASQTVMDLVLDDEAGAPIGSFPTTTPLTGMIFQPELGYRLSWFDGEDAGGTWTLAVRDDFPTADGGTLTGWGLTVCEPPPPPACGPGTTPVTVYSSDFEADGGGFTHTGTADEWALGTPSAPPITTCNSGTNCWKTDLPGTYNIDSSQDLLSPPIDLTGLVVGPVQVTWAQRYQLESASFDHYSVDVRQVGGASPTRLFEWQGATMTDTVGSPAVVINETAGWGLFRRDISAYAGQSVELLFHLDSDSSVNFAGAAVDDVTVTACQLPTTADLTITIDDGVVNAVPGGSVTYTIVAANPGPNAPASSGLVIDNFPAPCAGASWTCAGTGGATCTASGANIIADTAVLPSGGSATYTVVCNLSPGSVGSLINTAQIIPNGGVTDPDLTNNSATDTDALTPNANLSITKTDGKATAVAGTSVTYTITVSNSGPSFVTGATVTDIVPAALMGVTWSCGGGPGTCSPNGSGDINDTVDLPVPGSVTYTLTGTISASAAGSLSNTATITAPAGATDPDPSDNSATDTDVLVGLDYFALAPCRVVDTRGGAPIGGPVLQGQQTRTFAMIGLCGIPATAKAISINVAATQPSSAGNVRLFPAGQPVPITSSINYSVGQTRANNAVILLNAAGETAAFVGQAAGTTVHLIIDVNGYFE